MAIRIGRGPQRLLLIWTASGNYNYTDVEYGAPRDYRVETSGDSTNGADGNWSIATAVAGNSVRTRAHSFAFEDRSWVRLVVTAAPSKSPNGIQIDEIDVHDVSGGAQDTWFFLGDSITAFAFDRATPQDQPSFAENVHARHRAYFPAMINGGIGGEHAADGAARIDTVLALNPDFRFFAIAYGTNDEWGNGTDTSDFARSLQSIIDKTLAAGRVPVLARIPASPDGKHDTLRVFNAVIDQLKQANHLPAGPDLYAWFSAHADELQSDRVHPAAAGRVSMNRLWADAADVFYP